jgi:hypothetical protein
MKYRIRPYDAVADIWFLQRRVLLLFWKIVGMGTRTEVEALMDSLNAESYAKL